MVTNPQYNYDYGLDGPLAALQERSANPHLPVQISPPIGWVPLVLELHEALVAILPDYTIFQVKEKFAGLRFYINSYGVGKDDPRIDMAKQFIADAEALSYTTCQICGASGEVRKEIGYWATFCDEHNTIDSKWAKS